MKNKRALATLALSLLASPLAHATDISGCISDRMWPLRDHVGSATYQSLPPFSIDADGRTVRSGSRETGFATGGGYQSMDASAAQTTTVRYNRVLGGADLPSFRFTETAIIRYEGPRENGRITSITMTADRNDLRRSWLPHRDEIEDGLATAVLKTYRLAYDKNGVCSIARVEYGMANISDPVAPIGALQTQFVATTAAELGTLSGGPGDVLGWTLREPIRPVGDQPSSNPAAN